MPLKNTCYWLIFLISILISSCSDIKPELIPEDLIIPVRYSFHGSLLDNDLSHIPITTENLSAMQNWAIQVLLKSSNSHNINDKEKLLGELKRRLEENETYPVELQPFVNLTAEAQLISNLLVHRNPRGGRLNPFPVPGVPLNIIEHTINHIFHFPLDDDLLAKINALIAKLRSALSVLAARPTDEYIDSCRAASVPFPPKWDWPTPLNSWIARGELPPLSSFVGLPGVDKTVVYTYENNDGVCFALTRVRSEDNSLLRNSIICQSEETGKACFWENQSRGGSGSFIGPEVSYEIVDVHGGDVLNENCTDCHRGENAFVIHPETALQLSELDTNPAVWYQPVGQEDWSNPGPINLIDASVGQLSCTGCHQLPEVDDVFCEVILRRAAERTMPARASLNEDVPTVAGWPPHIQNEDYAFHIDVLAEECGF